MALSDKTTATVKATVPVLEAHGEAIVGRFYENLFRDYPVTKNFFNETHVKSGRQMHSLTNAVYAYAKNIDNLAVLLPAVERIAQKHVSFNVSADLYAVVGEVLLGAMKEILGDAATDDILAAWGEAYSFLADIFINRESDIRKQLEGEPGGYVGYRKMKVTSVELEAEGVKSIYLEPLEGKLPSFKPGQYLSFNLDLPGHEYRVVRNYSISCKSGAPHFRVTVKQEHDKDGKLGVGSGFFHEQVGEGTILEVGPPCGHFHLRDDRTSPVVLVAGGIGVTPLISMLESILDKSSKQAVKVLYAVRTPEVAIYKNQLDKFTASSKNLETHLYFTQTSSPEDLPTFSAAQAHLGRPKPESLPDIVPADSQIYVCGPEDFITSMDKSLKEMNITDNQIHYEVFGPEIFA